MFRDFLKDIPKKIAAVFTGGNFVRHFLMAAITFAVVESGLDWDYFSATRGILQSLGLPAAILGFFVPIVVPVGMYIVGELRSRPSLMKSGATIAQAEIIALLISSSYKVFTGRIQPEFYTFTSNIDISKQFNFGFLQHGVFWGWPSSHTTVAFAGAAALIALYPKSKIVRSLAVIYALYIGFGVSVSIHWLSDVIAGAILGILIGFTV